MYFADAVAPDLVLIALGPGPQGGSGTQLLASTATGGDIRNIGPHVPADETPDSVFFLDRTHGWFATYGDGAGSETLYRTRDGGRSWRSSPAPVHVLAAASTDAVQFVTPADGWLADIEPTGPAETLYRTTDGGAHWALVGRLKSGALPRLGLVSFEPGATLGWLAGGPSYRGRLEVTRDQARTWQAGTVPTRLSDDADVPTIFGTTLLDPVTRCADGWTALRTYLSADNGLHWALASHPDLARGCHQLSTAFPSRTTGWAATLSDGSVVVDRTTDQAHHWTTITAPRLRTHYVPTIVATDAEHAWLLVPGVDPSGTRVYVTDDGGRRWHRLDQDVTG